MPLSLISSAFADGERIPRQFTRDGENALPPMQWSGIPEETRSLAMVMEDPDAPGGTFRHLMMYDIPPACTGVPADVDVYTSEIRYADNDFGFARYDGPEPPPGRGSHRYRFRLMALDVPKLPLPHSAGAKHVLQEARKHMIAEAELIGCYER